MRWAFLAELYVSGEPARKSAESLLGAEKKGSMKISK